MEADAKALDMLHPDDDDLAGDHMDGADDAPLDIYDDDESDLSLSDDEHMLGSVDGLSDVGDGVGKPAIPRQEQVRMIHLRRYLDYLGEKVHDKEYVVHKTREELKKCKERIELLEQERDTVFTQIQSAESDKNISAENRLRATHERICEELENEEDLFMQIAAARDQAEYDLSQSQVEEGKCVLANDDLHQREAEWDRERSGVAKERREKEHSMAKQAEKKKLALENQRDEWGRHESARQHHLIDEAQRSQQKHKKFLEQTMDKLRRRESEEETRFKEHIDKRMNTMLALKQDIANNRENLRALQARDRAFARKEKQKEERQKSKILEAGGNPAEEMLKQARVQDFEKQKQQFVKEQRERQIDIAARILCEEERMKKRRQQQPYLWEDPQQEKAKVVKPHKKRKLQAFEIYKTGEIDMMSTTSDDLDFPKRSVDEIGDGDSEDDAYASFGENQVERIPDSESEDEGVNLAKPEFDGLWDQHKPYNVPKDMDVNIKLPGASKMEKEILTKVLDKQREGIVIRQVAGGKEFKGQGFYSKPDVIHFKDFDVGKTYKKKVTLTNVSYTVNYCKLTGITEHLKDFIDIHFDPPGQMSAGLTCEMLVTFKPMINEDLEGVVNFLAQTGAFSIPIICTTKKCDLKVDHTTVEFGTTVIGETLKRHITLINEGALGTRFEFYKITGLKQRSTTTAETSLGRLTTADTMRGVSPDSVEENDKGKDGKKGKKDKEKKEKEAEKPAGSDKKESDEEKGAEDATVKEKKESGGEDEEEEVEEEKEEELEISQDDSSSIEDDLDEIASLDGMKVGQVAAGEIGPHSTIKLEIIWQPTIPGRVDSEFILAFTDPLSENIHVQALAHAVDVPVWVERQTVDLKICMFDRLYQDTITVSNRATTALRLKFEVCKELRNHLELLPKTGYIQAQSTFSAQLKFLPRHSLLTEGGKYFDPETGVLEAPMVIRVADQTRPVPFTVHAVVTNSDLEFDTTDINFGCCTIYENVKQSVKLTNNSILPQKFGFVGIPEYIDVQPNDGFGTLLPQETIELDIIFKPKKARDYGFELKCKSLINREFKISCKGVGVHPPLDLSHQIIHFAATTVNDVSTAALHIINSHTSMNEFTHPVPRIGKGDIAPVGPTSFEFVVPEDAPLTISPSVGTVMPGKKCRVHVRFAPKLDDSDIRKEAVRMITKAREAQAAEEYRLQMLREKESAEQGQVAKSKGKPPAKGKPSPKGARTAKVDPSQATVAVKGPAPIEVPDEAGVDPNSDGYAAAHASLLRQYAGHFESFTIPCYVASGKCANPGELPYSVHNTLYLEVHCPAVKPELVVISDSGRTVTDFGNVSIGQSIIKSVTLQNISSRTVDLNSSLVDTAGPFQMLNALRALPPDASHTLLISFSPHKGRVFQEVLEVKSATSTLHITLKGEGVSPVVTLSIDNNELDMGAIIAGEYREDHFKIENTSTLAVHYAIKMDSQSLLHHSKAQILPEFILPESRTKNLVGTQNYSGQNVFDCVPAEGVIPAGGSIEIMATFAPDHASDYYSDGARIELFGQEEVHVFRIRGEAKPHVMYLTGGDELLPSVESLHIMPQSEEDDDAKNAPNPMLVTLHSVAKDTEFTMASRDIYVGCVRTMAVSQKKEGKKQNGEWTFDSLTAIANLGFNIDPVKGMLEAGTRRPITITWTPLPGHDPNKPVEASINVIITGDIKETYKIMLRALIVSE